MLMLSAAVCQSQKRDHLARARQLYENGRNEEAIAECNKSHTADSAALKKQIQRTVEILNWPQGEPPFKQIKTNDDGSKWITIDSKSYLAITREQADAWQILQNKYDRSQADIKDLNVEVKEAQTQVELKEAQRQLAQQRADSFEKDFNRSQEDAKRNFTLYMREHDLRVEAQQFIPHGDVGGFGGWLLKALDGPFGQVGFKLVIPTAQFIKVMKQ